MRNETHLEIGQILNHKYKVIDSLGDGGFGITYKVYDIEMKEHLGVDKYYAIKEYFPNSDALRKRNNTTVAIKSENKHSAFTLGLNSFLAEARALSQFDHPNIIKIETFFRENDTAYYVMPFIDAIDLDNYIKIKQGTISEAELKEKIIPVLYGLKEVHTKGIFHRDIKPENILIPKDGKKPPIIIDFGASRVAIGQESKNFQATVSEPYAPPEQYTDISSYQGSWTDIYSICMVMYQIVTNIPADKIPSSTTRNLLINDDKKDPLEYPKNSNFSKHLIDTIMKGLELKRKDRIETAQELIDLIINPIAVKPPSISKKIVKFLQKKSILIGVIILTIISILGIYQFTLNDKIVDNRTKIIYPTDKEFDMGKVAPTLSIIDLINIDRYKTYEEKYQEDTKRAIHLGFMMADVYFLRDLKDKTDYNSLLNIVKKYKNIYISIKGKDTKKDISLAYNLGLFLEDYRLLVEGLNQSYNKEETKILIKKELVDDLLIKVSQIDSLPYKSKILEGLKSIKKVIDNSDNTLSQEQVKKLLKPLNRLYSNIFLTKRGEK